MRSASLFLLFVACAPSSGDEAPGTQAGTSAVERMEPPQSGLRFAARREWALTAKPDGLSSSDLDGDGHSELLCVTRVPGELLVWPGSERGLGREPLRIACGDWPLRPVVLPAGTFGAPAGQRFVAVASRAQARVRVWDLASGEPRLDLDLGAAGAPRAMAAGALDGEGALLAVVTDTSLVVLPEEDPQSGLLSASAHGGVLPRCACLLSDGSIAVGYQGSSDVRIHRANQEPLVLALDGFPRELLELDWDADGDLELAVVGGDRSLWIFGVGAPGHAGEPLEIETDAIPLAARAADLDGDGADEIAILHHYGLMASVWKPGAPALLLGRVPAGQTPVDLTVLDADGDGELDVVVANRDTQGLSFLPGAHGRLETDVSVPVGVTPTSIAAADLDGDGLPELVVIASKDETLAVVDPRTREVLGQVPTGARPRAVTAVDLDGDGRDEVALLIGREQATELVILWATAAKGLERRADVPDHEVAQGGADLLFGWLFDPGGRPGAVVADPDAGALALVREAGGTQPAVTLYPALSAPLALAALELDGDPLTEIAVALGAPRAGIAVFDTRVETLTEVAFVPIEGAPIDIATVDLNGDGRSDLVALVRLAPESVEGFVLPLLQGPDGFTPLEPMPTGLNPHHVACTTVGDQAYVFVSAQNSHLINAWRAVGGSGLERLDDIGAGRGCLDLVVTDLDGNGRPDLAVANAFSDDVSLIFARD